jgi:predicted dehydrogenase
MAKLRVVGIDFDHMHMGDLLREVHDHADTEIAGVCDLDPKRMQSAIGNFSIPTDRVFTDVETCLTTTKPDLVVLCASPAAHARYVEQIAPPPLKPGE